MNSLRFSTRLELRSRRLSACSPAPARDSRVLATLAGAVAVVEVVAVVVVGTVVVVVAVVVVAVVGAD